MQSKAFNKFMEIAAKCFVVTWNFHFFYRDWKGVLKTEAFTKTTLVFWKQHYYQSNRTMEYKGIFDIFLKY